MLEFEAPNRIVLTWNILERGASPTEVEVRFTPEGDTTRVDLEHRGWETVAENREAKRDSYDAGWDHVLGCYGRRAG